MNTTSEAEGLAARLRAATMPQHQDAETKDFVTRLMGGELSLAAYTEYLAQYAYVYEALEARQARAGDPQWLHDERLRRLPSIEADLAALGVAQWRESHPPLPATTAYVAAIREAHASVPRHVAHHYTRYLGDLSGGQAIAALVARHYGASPEQLTFYRFAGIDSPVVFKRAYREGLDSLDLAPDQERALISEAQLAFACNAELFDALAQRVPATAS